MQCQPPVREWLIHQAVRLGPAAFIVEVGTWRGDTARLLGAGGATVLCIDRFSGVGMSNAPRSTLRLWVETVAGTRVVGLMGDSAEAATLLQPGSVDLVFIDADHSYEAVKRDIEAWRNRVTPQGFLCGDDWNMESVRRAVRETLGEPQVIGEYGWWVQL